MDMENVIELEVDVEEAKQGLSAYEVYLSNGGTLSEEEWLESLKGTTPTIGENGNWFLGDIDTGLPSRGAKGEPGSIKFIPVTELPTENIDDTAIYVKPSDKPDAKNKYEEFIYVNNDWEPFGGGGITVNLDNYVTKEELNNAINEIDSDTEIFYAFSTVEEMQVVVDALKQGKKAILVPKGQKGSSGEGNFEETVLYSPDTSSIDWSTYAGYLYFKSDWWMSPYENPNYNRRVDLTPKWKCLKVYVSDNGTVKNISSSYKTHNNALNVSTVLPVLGKNNAEEYTPTGDYHPATKKYVDDAILGVATGDTYYISDTTVAPIGKSFSSTNSLNEQMKPIITKHMLSETPFTLIIRFNGSYHAVITFNITKLSGGYRNNNIYSTAVIYIEQQSPLYARSFKLNYTTGADETVLGSCSLTSDQPLEKFATEEFVTNSIQEIPSYSFTIDGTINGIGSISEEKKTELSNIITKFLKQPGIIYIHSSTASSTVDLPVSLFSWAANGTTKTYRFIGHTYSNALHLCKHEIETVGKLENDVYTISRISSKVTDIQGLSKSNTTAYTPTGDYNPATKKYVDDSINEINDNTINVVLYKDTNENENNIAKIQAILPHILTKDIILRVRSKTSTTISTTGHPTYYLDGASVSSITDITAYTGDIRWFSDTWKELRTSDGGITEYNRCDYVTVKLTDGIVTKIESLSGSNNSTSYVKDLNVLTKNNVDEYIPLKDYNPATKKYVDDITPKVFDDLLINAVTTDDMILPVPDSTPEVNYEVVKLGTSNYEFVLDETTGYYTSNNNTIANSYALSKVNISSDKAIKIKISYINHAQAGNDYGIFSNVDTELTDSRIADTTNVFLSLKDKPSSPDVKAFYMDIPAGEHFFTVKYLKNSSINKEADSLQFKIEQYWESANDRLATKKYVDDSVNDITPSPIYLYKMPKSFKNAGSSMGLDDYDTLASIINSMYKNGDTTGSILVQGNDTMSALLHLKQASDYTIQWKHYSYTFSGVIPYGYNKDKTVMRTGVYLSINGSWTDDVFTCTSASIFTGVDYDFAPKEYVDNSIANIDLPEVDDTEFILKLSWATGGSNINMTDTENLTAASEFINKMYNYMIDGTKAYTIKILNKLECNDTNNTLWTPKTVFNTQTTSYTINGIFFRGLLTAMPLAWQLTQNTVTITGTWTDNVFTATKVNYTVELNKMFKPDDYTKKSDVLTKTNTTSFTPTGNYHPATKKYVDDAVTNIDIPEKLPIVVADVANSANTSFTGDDLLNLEKAINDAKDFKDTGFHLMLRSNSFGYPNGGKIYTLATAESDGSRYRFDYRAIGSSSGDISVVYELYINGSWTDDVFTATRAEQTEKVVYLATRTYVDNAIAAAITTVLEGEY